MRVQAPDGQTWRVTRRWFPWRWRWRETDGGDAGGGWDLGDDLVIGLVLVVVIAVLTPFVLPILVGAVELVLILLVLPAAVLGRVLLGRKWSVEVRRGFRPWHEEVTGSWSDASVRITELAAELERGDVVPRTIRVAPATKEAP